MRLFFALWPDSRARARMEALGVALPMAASAPLADQARRVSPSNYHLTVAFLGEVAETSVDALRTWAAAQHFPGFALTFDAYEYWPKPEVVVAAARQIPTELELLWQAMHIEIAAHGLGLNPKRLRPHVTLTRKVTQAPVLPTMSPFEWQPQSFSLVRSDRGGSSSVYTVVDTWPLLYAELNHSESA